MAGYSGGAATTFLYKSKNARRYNFSVGGGPPRGRVFDFNTQRAYKESFMAPASNTHAAAYAADGGSGRIEKLILA